MSRICTLISISAIAALASIGAEAATKKTSTHTTSRVETTSSEIESPSSPLDGRLLIEPNFGLAFLSPGDINSTIHDLNDTAVQQKGIKTFNMGDIGSGIAYGGAVSYRIVPAFALGIGLNRVSGSSDASAKLNNTATLDATTGIAATLLTAETHITVLHSADQKFEALISPFIGVGFYSSTSTTSGLAGGSSEEDDSAKGVVFGSTLGARYWLIPNLALGINAGYRYAKSGDLKVDTAKNDGDTTVGNTVEIGGKKITVDASSFLISTQLTWAI